MKKFVNFRLPVIFSLMFAAGICAGLFFFKNNISLLWIIAVIPVTAVVFIFLCLFANMRSCTILLICSLVFIAGAANCYMRLERFNNTKLAEGEIYEITATVKEKGLTEYGEYLIVKNARTKGLKLDGDMRVNLGEVYGDFCEAGYKVKFTAKISAVRLFEYGKLNTYAEKNIKYVCSVYGQMQAERGFSLFAKVRSSVKRILFNSLDNGAAAVVYAMLTGDSDNIDSGITQTFRYGGIAHIFAVSGLHIGIVYGLFRFLLKVLRHKRFLYAALCIAPVALYAGICGFTLSSVRALIMCAVAATAKCSLKKYDGLNALAISSLLILSFTPLSAFSVGFQLSFSAVAGILILKLPKKLPEFLRVPLAAQAGTMPVMLANFGYLSGVGLLMNIIIIPVLSATFILMFTVTAVCLIIPAAAFLLPVAAFPIDAVLSFLISIGFEKALISGFCAGFFIPLYYVLLLTVSDKLNLKILKRLTAAVCAFCVLAVYVICKHFMPLDGFGVMVSADYGGGCVLIKSNGQSVLIITEGISENTVNSFLNKNYVWKLSAAVILGGEDCVLAFDYLDCPAFVYGGYLNLQPSENSEIFYEESFSAVNAHFDFADGYSVLVRCGEAEIAVCAGENVPFGNCDLLIYDGKADCECVYNIGFNEQSIEYNVYRNGDFNFTVKNAEIKINKTFG